MYNLALRIWLSAQLVFISGIGIYSICTGSFDGEVIAAGIFVFVIGMACSAPAFFLLGWLLKPAMRLAGNTSQALLTAAIAAALSAVITYTAWWLFINSNDYTFQSYAAGLPFLLGVIGATTIATLLQYRQVKITAAAL